MADELTGDKAAIPPAEATDEQLGGRLQSGDEVGFPLRMERHSHEAQPADLDDLRDAIQNDSRDARQSILSGADTGIRNFYIQTGWVERSDSVVVHYDKYRSPADIVEPVPASVQWSYYPAQAAERRRNEIMPRVTAGAAALITLLVFLVAVSLLRPGDFPASLTVLGLVVSGSLLLYLLGLILRFSFGTERLLRRTQLTQRDQVRLVALYLSLDSDVD